MTLAPRPATSGAQAAERHRLRSTTSWRSRRQGLAGLPTTTVTSAAAALVRILEPGLTAAAACGAAKAPIDRGRRAAGPWRAIGPAIGLDVRRDGRGAEHRASPAHRAAPRRAPWLEVEVDVVNRGAADPSTPTCASSGASDLSGAAATRLPSTRSPQTAASGTPRPSHDGAERPRGAADGIACGNDHDGVRVDVTVEPAARLTWFADRDDLELGGRLRARLPGLVAALLAGPLGLAAGDSISVRQRFAIERGTRDLAAEATVAG